LYCTGYVGRIVDETNSNASCGKIKYVNILCIPFFASLLPVTFFFDTVFIYVAHIYAKKEKKKEVARIFEKTPLSGRAECFKEKESKGKKKIDPIIPDDPTESRHTVTCFLKNTDSQHPFLGQHT